MRAHRRLEVRYGRFRDECLNETLLTSLMHACQILADWRADYNTVRPHIPNWMANTGPGRQTRVSRAWQNGMIIWIMKPDGTHQMYE
ncbi:hypothetical protein CFR76_16405 [Komagataeibacter swingsii]|uniref:Integrase catalytic domain-containing protein n=1 Tax=Komagataeibacter swingsii TaxID=215220 RepID=A0A2V4RHU9_9PROT|nr:hypothetical protein CFR76_16405 [Komagataeibacter swingsii]